MQVKIQRWGHSAAIRLPPIVLEQMSLTDGDVLELEMDLVRDMVHLKPVSAKPRYQLADLMAQCDLSVPGPKDPAWDSLQPIGHEK